LVLACDGHEIEGAEEKAVAHFNRLEASQLPDKDFVVDYLRAGKKQTARLKLTPREPAQADDVELRSWGVVVRDLTQKLVREERLTDARGVWFENVRPAGPSGQAEPSLRRGDIVVSVDGQPVSSGKSLKEITDKLLVDAPDGKRTVLVGVRRDAALLSSVVELRKMPERNITPQARKAWLGIASQPLTPKLGSRLGIKSDGGARVTRVYPGTQAATAGLQVGDVILAIDGSPVTARRPEDVDVLARQIRQYKADTVAAFTVWREGKNTEVKVKLELQPLPGAELPWWEDLDLEFSAREIAFEDRVRLQMPPDEKGVLIETAVPAGWAALGGLRSDDVVEKVGDTPVSTLAELKAAREAAARSGQAWWVLLVNRRGQNLFVEINLKPAKK
jgi:S1-C subfamily serine protease